MCFRSLLLGGLSSTNFGGCGLFVTVRVGDRLREPLQRPRLCPCIAPAFRPGFEVQSWAARAPFLGRRHFYSTKNRHPYRAG